MPEQDTPCHCESGRPFTQCCGPCIAGEKLPKTAEELMRSRYSAFVTRDPDYLLATWHPSTRPPSVEFSDGQRWLGLKIKKTTGGQAGDLTGEVEFVARYKIDGRGHRLQEQSRFSFADGRWYYVDGDFE